MNSEIIRTQSILKRSLHQHIFTPMLFAVIFSGYAMAEESAEKVQTSGMGDLSKFSNFLIFSSSTSYKVKVPESVQVGDRLELSYEKDGKPFRESFPVIEISARSDRCWLYSERRAQYSTALADNIHVKPCRVTR